MANRASYGTLSWADEDTVEFTVAGRIVRAWRLSPPITTLEELFHQSLASLGEDGWRPISHQSQGAHSVILARVPYPAGSKLSVFGTLRFLDPATLVLSVGGSVMQRWKANEKQTDLLAEAVGTLERQGWRLHRRYGHGATLVRG